VEARLTSIQLHENRASCTLVDTRAEAPKQALHRGPADWGGRSSALGPLYRVTTRLVVDRARLRATLYKSGRVVWRSRIGIGAAATPTPPGDSWVREKFRVTRSGGPYGPRALGTSTYSKLTDWPGGGVIGIHGTNAPPA
jgi:hypothetical protein